MVAESSRKGMATTAATHSEADPPAGSPRAGRAALAVVTHNSRADLTRTLDGMIDVADRLGAPLVVVDNASTDGTAGLLADRAIRHDGLRVVALDRNLGYAAAVNRAFAAVPGLDVMVLNPDVELSDPEQVVELSAFLARNPRAGVAAPRLMGEDGEPQPSARRFPSLLSMLGSLPTVGRLSPARRAYERYVAPSSATAPALVEWAIGAAMLIRRAAYEAVGGWDERYFLYMEDADFCRRCAAAGWGVWFVPGVALHHGYTRASSRPEASVRSSVARRRHVASLARFFARSPRLLLRG